MPRMTASRRIYLDNAATSWPKPPAVYDAVDHYQRHIGAPAGRGAYAEGQAVEREIGNCRRKIAELIGTADSHRVVFGFNGTDVLNIALHGIIRPGDHVVTSVAEHNSVLRPLRWLQDRHEISVTYVDCDPHGVLDAEAVLGAVTAKTNVVAVTHASNVTGALQPVEAIGQRLRDTSAFFLVDAAQSMGHVPIDVRSSHIDLLAASGHKGLLGPLGTGVSYASPNCEPHLESFRQGGTGTQSEVDVQPGELPHKLEAGNFNVPALYGLSAGLSYLNERGLAAVRQHELQLTALLRERLAATENIQLVGPVEAEKCTGVTSFVVKGMEPQEVASLLDSAFQIEVRAGLHCAPRMHEALGTKELGGAVRASFGPFNTEDDIAALVAAVGQIATLLAETE